MSERTSLPACAKNHPNIPSDIKVTVCTRVDGTTFERPYCTLCTEITSQAQAAERRGRGRGADSPVKGYGVLRLGWAAPEMLLQQE